MPYAIDLFCGAGGFSEGIIQAGFDIIFSSDKSPMVEETYTNRHRQLGLIEGEDTHFELADIKELTAEVIFNSINSLRYGEIFDVGSVDAIFGGPPCQGFSRLGKRDSSDPRNMLFHEYLRIIRDIRPSYVVMENVTGILDMHMLDFPSVLNEGRYEGQVLVKEILRQEFEGLGYNLLDVQVLNAANYGVPQQRNRVVFLAYRNDVTPIEYPEVQPENEVTVFDALGGLYDGEHEYQTDYSFNSINGRTPHVNGNPIPAEELENMEISNHDDIIHERFSLYNEGENRRKAVLRFQEDGLNLRDKAPHLFKESLFQLNSESNSEIIIKKLEELNLMKNNFNNSKWLHYTNRQLSKLEIAQEEDLLQFQKDLRSLSNRIGTDFETTLEFWNNIFANLNRFITEDEYEQLLLNGKIDNKMAEAIFTKKGIRTRLDRTSVSPTMVTLPDDFIHPYFNRVLTVREMARIQSFDDSFVFLGKRTTGGKKRSQETPQFTQVGNAVPPLLARAIAEQVMAAVINQ